MRHHFVQGSRIAGVSCAVPSNVVGNMDERAAKAVGVHERRFISGDTDLGVLALTAAERLLQDLNWGAESVDGLVFVTQTSPRRMPSISCELHSALGMRSDTPAFDMNMACSGYVYGLWAAASLRLPRCLLIVGDTISQYLDSFDPATYPIFGDAVSATAIEMTGDNVRIEFVGGTDGSRAEALKIAHEFESDQRERLRMDGTAVFNFAVQTVPGLVADTTMNGYVDWYLFHQANAMMLQHIAKKAKIESFKMPMNIGKYGNTSSASIPLLMCDSECTPSLNTRKNVLAMFGFGAGLSWGGIRTEVDAIPTSIVEV